MNEWMNEWMNDEWHQSRRQGTFIRGAFEFLGGGTNYIVCVCVCVCVMGGGGGCYHAILHLWLSAVADAR